MMGPPEQSRSAIDRIGDRLKDGDFSPTVLEALDTFRSSHDRIIPMVLKAVDNDFGTLTLRAAKSTPSIVAKLRRESARLSQIQDIAGCRIIVRNIRDQFELVEDSFDFVGAALSLRGPDSPIGYRLLPPSVGIRFERAEGHQPSEPIVPEPVFEPVGEDTHVTTREFDRVNKPQFGYRAIHLVVAYRKRFMEVQIRTQLQHAWAEVSEKTADKYGHDLKYGRGARAIFDKLISLSEMIAEFEIYEANNPDKDDTDFEAMRRKIHDALKSETIYL